MKDNIEVIQPMPYQEVGCDVIISGWVSKSLMDTGFRRGDDVFLDFIDIDGCTFLSSSANIVKKSWLSKFRKRLRFYTVVQFRPFDVYPIARSQGRIAIKLMGHNIDYRLFVPIIVKNSNPSFKASPEIIEKHGKIGEMVMKYEREWEEYSKEFEKIMVRRQKKSELIEYEDSSYKHVQDQGLKWGIFRILSEECLNNEDNPFAQEDKELQQLEVKYENAIRINGPLLGKDVLTYCGFHFIIRSNDHGRHFHIIHNGKRLNARILFPEIEIESYACGTLQSKKEKEITSFLKQPENFSKLEKEFLRRDNSVN